MRIITNWENDLTDVPEESVVSFVKENYPNYEFKLLSGLAQRDINDIYDSLKESRIVIIQPTLFDRAQVSEILSSISHPTYGALIGNTREWEIRDFVFLSNKPYEVLKELLEICSKVKDRHGEHSLPKILAVCEIHSYGYDGEHYEVKFRRYSDYEIIRYK